MHLVRTQLFNRIFVQFACLAFCFALSINWAGAETNPDDSGLVIHGFVSQGYIQTTNNNFVPNSLTGSTDFSEAGININKQFTPDLRVGIQLFARDFGGGDFDTKLDWFDLDYHWRDWLGVRAGRVKLPFGLYNDSSDIDAARNSILLPQSVYPNSDRDYLLAQTGVELYGFANVGSLGSLEYQIYRGSIQLDVAATLASPYQEEDIYTPYIMGGRLIWNTPIEGLRFAGSAQKLQVNADVLITSTSQSFTIILPITMAIWSVEYTKHDFDLTAEYSRWWAGIQSTNSSIVPPSGITSERYYGMASFRVNDWLHPGLYYSVLFPNVDDHQGRENVQNDLAAFVRFDINNNWLFKLEGHYMDGTAGLASNINDNKPLSELNRDWALFMVKTTALF
jgi:hypothetical protein